jgi:hypothetical protein
MVRIQAFAVFVVAGIPHILWGSSGIMVYLLFVRTLFFNPCFATTISQSVYLPTLVARARMLGALRAGPGG